MKKSTITSNLSPEKERLAIRDISIATESLTKEGDLFYLLTHRWWHNWLDYVDGLEVAADNNGFTDFKRPSGINNYDLINRVTTKGSDVCAELRDGLVEGTDYILLPKAVWNQLHAWYGGGPALARKVISSGISQTELSVEVYPLRLQLHLIPKGDQSSIRISKKETVGELHKKACEIYGLTTEQTCIWDYFGHRKQSLMNDLDKSLDDVNIQMNQDILVEVIDSSGCTKPVHENGSGSNELTVFVDPSKASLSITGGLSKGHSRNSNSALSQFQNHTTTREVEKTHGQTGVSTRGSSGGLTGLHNLGNTCFMNSAIQCLVHTPEFATYFLDDYHQEINWHNPLGMVGELAVAFGDLLRKLWAPGRNSVAPRPFKAKLARFAPQFSGYNQHDSQELLAFLLDGLHEDLNRVKHKPYLNSRDADGRPDEEVADEYWSNHIARNNSIIVDVCQGQYKSTLVCPVCDKMSVTFDPFMYLSLPLQSTSTRTMTVTVFTCDGSALPAACTINVPKQGRCRDLIQALSNACSLKHNEKLLLAEIRNHLINRFLEEPLMSLSSIRDDDHLAAYKFPKFVKNFKFLQLIHRREEQDSGSSQQKEWKPYGTPLVSPISCEDTVTSGDIQSAVQTLLSPMLKVKTENVRHSDISNVSAPASDPPPAVNNSTGATNDCILADLKQECGNIKVITSQRLPLQLVDENNACIDLSIGEEKAFKIPSSSRAILVFIDWSHKLLDNYESTCLENLPDVKNGAVTKKARIEPLSLYTCLEAFLREEPLVPEDMWYCPQCKERRQASKKLDLWRLPEVLVIHLKRFSYSRSMKHKLETFVNFPIYDFDLTNYVANKRNSRQQLYELYALTNHYGGMGSGHYTAYIKLLDENRWYNFDDTHISPINEDEVRSGAAYVLFYRRVKTDTASASSGAPVSAGHNNLSSQK
uniref:Ubiquitin carboxyl-terminal hydrolase n=1 Tax=Daucus carota subsp. sativus TaxID=79200 RepID=A0A162A4S0_DAUCS|nr:PREDICTED: ubiquitin carboxyl-terminal hydrolase 5 isoform X1 [Daucus carota subsp. sativus]